MEGIISEGKFYALIYSKLKADMEEKGITAQALREKESEYVVKSSQFYSIKRIAEAGDEETGAPRLSNSRLEKVCDYLGIEFRVLYQVEKNGISVG